MNFNHHHMEDEEEVGTRAGGEGFSDIMELLRGSGFGGMGGNNSRRNKGPKKGEPVKQVLKVNLEDLYNGGERKIKITRTRCCKDCKGTGTNKPDATKTCINCKGRGIVMEYRNLGPGLVQQVQTYCSDCAGKGKTIDDKFKCKICNGNCVVDDVKIFTVQIEKGSKDGQKIIFENEGDEIPGVLPGDIYFFIQQEPHKIFQRDGSTLFVKKKITLTEALTGLFFKLEHLDKRILFISTKQIIKPLDTFSIENEGMPSYKNKQNERGLLIFQFEVEFPKKIPEGYFDKLKKIFPPLLEKIDLKQQQQKNKDPEEEQQQQHVTELDLEEPIFSNQQEQRRHREAYDTDEDHEGGGGGGGSGIQCAHQ